MTTEDSLLRAAEDALPEPLYWDVVQVDEEWVAHLARRDGGSTEWNYGSRSPTRVLAAFAAEQRYLAEQVGSGTVPGNTYLDKALERVRRLQEAPR